MRPAILALMFLSASLVLGQDSNTHIPQQETNPPLRIRVSEGVSRALILKKVDPLCPRDMKCKGTVVLQAVIDEDGKVVNLKYKTGHPLLVSAAIDAAKQYVYKPYYLNRKPVQIETEISVEFEPRKNT